MKFNWKYDHVKDGLEPDENGKWSLGCYIEVTISDGMPEYKTFEEAGIGSTVMVRVATVTQRDCIPDVMPTDTRRFHACVLSLENGFVEGLHQKHVYADELEDIKQMVEFHYASVRNAFVHAL